MSGKIRVIPITRDNYSLFKALVHWRLTGTRKKPADLPAPTKEELEFAGYDGFWVWAAAVDGILVGWITCALIPKPDRRRGTIYIDELWVAPAYRRKGIARALMEEAISKARQLNMWMVRLYAGKTNDAARSLYEQIGFFEGEEESMFWQRKP